MDPTPDDLFIRRATRLDGRDVERLWLELLVEMAGQDGRLALSEDALVRWRADYPEWIRDTTRLLSVSEERDRISGFVSAHLWGPEPIFETATEVFIEYLYVRPQYRRLGIGRELVRHAVDWGMLQGATRVRLKSPARSEAARTFWQREGAEPLAVEMTFDIGNATPLSPKSPIGFRGNSP